ncbi:golgin subfamily A member 6-like protein 22 isoform X5 [Hippocampus zosterae]|uniref:golgin subfamily A member 6-like protein 22 isoform X5 n=1 Tax=Hippocampus zosterae TaxID=109293 RepID=UPI00223E5022|nr:golgin subfamily A member 6-like protein 22 isoform X5 [Hippocampus zosterae]
MSFLDQPWCPTSVQVTVLQARGLRAKGKGGTNDAYALMQVGKEKYQTSVVEKSVAPVWKEEAAFELPQHGAGGERGTLRVHVLHRALVGPDKLLGQAVIDLVLLAQDKSRNKTEWFKLLDKSGKADKDRGEVLVDIQFMRNNMTASMFDLSAAGKSRSRLGKLKDKVRGKKKEWEAPAAASTQVLTDSEEEEDGEAAAGKEEEKKKKPKIKSLFSHKSNLQRNMSQSMSILPAKNTPLSGSLSSGLNADASEGKKKFKFMKHKRSGSSDSKESSSSQKRAAVEKSNLCINGSHVYCEELPPRTARIGSNFSLGSSGRGSMEDVPESFPPSLDSLPAIRQHTPWEEEEEVEQEEEREEKSNENLDGEEEMEARGESDGSAYKVRVNDQGGMTREGERDEEMATIEEEEEEARRQDLEKRRQEERARREELERVTMEKRRREEERRRREELDRLEQEERKREEERKKEEEERLRREELERVTMEKRRREEEERRREEEERRTREELARLEEEKRRQEEEERRREEEERLEEEERKKEEEERLRREELERLTMEKRSQEVEQRKREEEERRRREELDRLEEEERKEEERLRREELERVTMEKMRREAEERRTEEEKARKEEEEERGRLAEEKRREEELKRREEMLQRRELERIAVEEEREARERLRQESKREEESGRVEEEKLRREEEKARREEEERERFAEERRNEEKEEERERLVEEQRRLEEKARKEEEEEERVRRREEKQRLAEEEQRLAEEERAMEEEREGRRKEEERLAKEREAAETQEKACQAKREEQQRRKEQEEESGKLAQEEERRRVQDARGENERKKLEEEEKQRQEREPREEAEEERERRWEEGGDERRKEPRAMQDEAQEQDRPPSAALENAQVHSANPFDEDDIPNPAPSSKGSTTDPTVAQRCRPAEPSTAVGPREKRPAPRPPTDGRHDPSAHPSTLPEKVQEKEVKTASVPPRRSVQTTPPRSTSPSDEPKGGAIKRAKGPAPSIPAAESKTVPVVRHLNPFDDDDDDEANAAQNDASCGHRGSASPLVSQTPDSDAASQSKVKSSKAARAPPPPADTAAASVPADTKIQAPKAGQASRTRESPPKEPKQRGQQGGGLKKEAPPAPSRRLQPVKPLSAQEQHPVTEVQVEKEKSGANVGQVEVNVSKEKGPYSMLTREELVSLVVKQEKQLRDKDKKIAELEQYIDNLLVRVMEEQPSILMSLKKVI